MIKTIDEAVAILNAHKYRTASNWNVVMRNTDHRVVEGGFNVAFTDLEAIAIARSLAGDYEALERQVQRLREAAEETVRYLGRSEKTYDLYLIKKLSSALSSIEEETDSGDTLSANQS